MTAPRSRAATLLLPRYLEHRERDVVTLRQSVDEGDFESITRIGHNLRGNGRSYGFPEVGELGEALEAAARSRNTAAVREHVCALEAWVAHNRETPSVQGMAPSRPESSIRVRTAGALRDAQPDDHEDEDD